VKEPTYYINTKFVPKSKAYVHVNDLGFLRGYGVFDFLVTYNKKPFLLNKHVRRLFNSAEQIGLKIPCRNQEMTSLINKCVRKNTRFRELAIKIIITGGISKDGLTPSDTSTLAILTNQRKKLPGKLYKEGAKVITVDIQRDIPTAKTLNYTNAVYSMKLARKASAVEAIYIDKKEDVVYEGTTSNLFLVKKSKIFTPETDILPGVTRELVISLAKKHFKLETKKISFRQLITADEVFITASNKEVLPIVKVDRNKINGEAPGKVTKKIISEYKEYINTGKW
jgi:branched-chain amino acid aminotransferase